MMQSIAGGRAKPTPRNHVSSERWSLDLPYSWFYDMSKEPVRIRDKSGNAVGKLADKGTPDLVGENRVSVCPNADRAILFADDGNLLVFALPSGKQERSIAIGKDPEQANEVHVVCGPDGHQATVAVEKKLYLVALDPP